MTSPQTKLGLRIDLHLDVLHQANAFLCAEADLLDHGEFGIWLDLWTSDGLYIVPVDPAETDFEGTLNYAYDDHHMREKRVARLGSGESISTTPQARTVRSVSRVRVIGDDGLTLTVRAAQDLKEFRKDVLRQHIADVTYELTRTEHGGHFKLHRKVIRLINSTDSLTPIGYIL